MILLTRSIEPLLSQNNDPALTSLTVGIDLDIYDMSQTDGFLPVSIIITNRTMQNSR